MAEGPDKQDETAPLAEVRAVDAIRSEFEEAWDAGQPNQIERFLEGVSHDLRPAALHELIVLEIDLRRAAGESLELAEYERRFPQHNDCVKAALAVLDRRRTDPADQGRTEAGQYTPSFAGAGTVIGRYKLLERLGEGGFGEVWAADQSHPVKRRVALKIIKLGMDTKEVIARFEVERQALALMDHPNIAKVLDAGTTESGRPYFVMELVQGIPITEFCDQKKLAIRDRLELFVLVCQAIQHAHQKGVIHRDIKPSNVLASDHGSTLVPKVIDFGVAKAINQRLTEQTVYTMQQQMIGTPLYMSPEQADLSALDVDTRSDIYSLGVLLYEMLTGVTPFEPQRFTSAAYDQIRRIIREEPPPLPSTRISTLGEQLPSIAEKRKADARALRGTIRGELDWIAMKALEKDRSRRYETAAAFGMDIHHYLTNQPVSAGRPSAVYQFKKFVRRNRVLFMATAAVVAALLVGTIVSTIGFVSASMSKNAETIAREQAEQNELASRRNAYAADMNLAMKAVEDSNFGTTRTLLERHRPSTGQVDLRGWEWRYLWRRCRDQSLFTFPPRERGIYGLDLSHDGRFLAVAALDGIVELWDFPTRRRIGFVKHSSWGVSVAISPSGDRLASCAFDENVKLWTLPTLESIAELEGRGKFNSPVFSPDGKYLAAFAWNDEEPVKLWDVEAAKKVAAYPAATTDNGFGGMLSFSPDGQRLAIGQTDGLVRILRVPSGEELLSIQAHDTEVSALAFSPQADVLASACRDGPSRDASVLLWSTVTGERVGTLRGHKAYVRSIEFLPDATTLATASGDNAIGLWSLTDATEPRFLTGHTDEVWAVDVTPDGKMLVSGGQDGKVKQWSSGSHSSEDTYQFQATVKTAYESEAVFSPNGNSIGLIDRNGYVVVLDSDSLQQAEKIDQLGNQNCGLLFSRDGTQLVVTNQTGGIRVWNLKERQLVADFTGHSTRAVPLAILPRAGILVTQERPFEETAPCELRQWDVASWRVASKGITVPNVAEPNGQAISPDGRIIATARWGGPVSLWDRTTGQPLGDLVGHKRNVPHIDFSPDGRMLATACWDGSVKIWDIARRQELATLRGDMRLVNSVGFSPDGKRLLCGLVYDVKLWDTATRREVVTLKAKGDHLHAVFSPDGNSILATSSRSGSIEVWHAPSWEGIESAEAAAGE